jgi:membrane fusion protein (multidrug efflux system)
VGPDNKVERRDLVVGEWTGEDWIIEKGIAAGERVIVDGVQRVQAGVVVAPVDAGAGARQAAPAAPEVAPSKPAAPAPGSAPPKAR